MTEYLEITADKFIFKIAKDRFYSNEGVWARLEGNLVRIGLSDFVQQHNGDIAFAEVKPLGTEVAFGDEVAVIETIKVDISLTTPVSGIVVEVNPAMQTTPEIINQDSYGTGWLAVIEPMDWEADCTRLLNPHAYFVKMKIDVEKEVNKIS
jgi:glycine cleavage system H protein